MLGREQHAKHQAAKTCKARRRNTLVLTLISIIFMQSFAAFSLNISGLKTRLPLTFLPQAKYPVPTFQTRSPPDYEKRSEPHRRLIMR